MKKLSKAVFTMMVIFGAAYILAASGCAGSSGNDGKNVSAPVQPNGGNNGGDDIVLQPDEPTTPAPIRECTNNEFAQLQSWRNAVNAANELIDAAQGKQQSQAVNSSLKAIGACDSRYAYHKAQPCTKTVNNIVGTQVKKYDAATIKKDCSKVDAYLTKYNLRPKPGATPNPTPNPQPLPVDPVQPPVIDNGNQGSMSACSQDEFSKLSEWASAQDRANKSIAKLGSQDSWKYDEQAIINASPAVKQCESLMKYHSQSPCERSVKQDDGSSIKRQYTRETLAERCNTSRKYFYEYVQNKSTLVFANADLYVDLSRFAQQRFEASSFGSFGNCVVENRTDNTIDYSGRKALVTETRGFEQKMLVLITAEGLKIDCYGLDIGDAFSKTEIVRVLKKEGTDIGLEYRLK